MVARRVSRPVPRLQRKAAGSFIPGIGAIEGLGDVRVGTITRKRVVKRPAGGFLPGLGAWGRTISNKIATVQRQNPSLPTTVNRWINRPPVGYNADAMKAAAKRGLLIGGPRTRTYGMFGLGELAGGQVFKAKRTAPRAITITRMIPSAAATPISAKVTKIVPSVQRVTPLPPAGGRVKAPNYAYPMPVNDSSLDVYEDSDAAILSEDDEGFGPTEDDTGIGPEENDGFAGLFDIQIGAGTLALLAIGAYFLAKSRKRA